ncbi:hypothetical protein CR513_58616, partial [Mucuna pruriens]
MFQKLGLLESELEECPDTLIGCSKIRRVISLEMTFEVVLNTYTITMKFTIINAQTSYNIILGCPTLNRFVNDQLMYEVLERRLGGVIQANQHVARRCCEDSLRVRDNRSGWKVRQQKDPQLDQEDVRPQSGEDLKEVQISPKRHLKTKIGGSLDMKMRNN